MKRSGFKNKIRKPMKRSSFKHLGGFGKDISINKGNVMLLNTKFLKMSQKRSTLHKHSKQDVSVIQTKIWELCRLISMIIYPSDCYTCPKKDLIGEDRQLGHMKKKSTLGAFLKYDLRILRWQCKKCNIRHDGDPEIEKKFESKMRLERGDEYVDKIYEDMKISVNASDHYQYLKVKYNVMLEQLQRDPHRLLVEPNIIM